MEISTRTEDGELVLCASSIYNQKFYLNKEFSKLPDEIKDELHAMCGAFTQEVGGIFMLVFDDAGNLEALQNYLKTTNNALSLFDVPLHYNLFNACHSNGTYDMRTIFNNTLVAENPNSAVTFVDNHDTEPGQALQSWIDDWFKPLAYSLILLRKDGLPCVFYGDYYGIPAKNVSAKKDWLEKLIYARKNFAYGSQIDYFNDTHIIGWVRTGDRRKRKFWNGCNNDKLGWRMFTDECRKKSC